MTIGYTEENSRNLVYHVLSDATFTDFITRCFSYTCSSNNESGFSVILAAHPSDQKNIQLVFSRMGKGRFNEVTIPINHLPEQFDEQGKVAYCAFVFHTHPPIRRHISIRDMELILTESHGMRDKPSIFDLDGMKQDYEDYKEAIAILNQKKPEVGFFNRLRSLFDSVYEGLPISANPYDQVKKVDLLSGFEPVDFPAPLHLIGAQKRNHYSIRLFQCLRDLPVYDEKMLYADKKLIFDRLEQNGTIRQKLVDFDPKEGFSDLEKVADFFSSDLLFSKA